MPAGVLQEREPGRTSGGGLPPISGHGGGGGNGEGAGFGADPARFGLWVFLGTVSMLFIGFTSAYMVRRASADWRPLAAPPLVWLNTAALLASSVTLEVARRRLRGWELAAVQAWVAGTAVLGLLFLTGQIQLWRSLTARGLSLAASPHNSFVYVLSGIHLLHLAGGLVWLAVAAVKARLLRYTPGEDGLALVATYWHFLGALWLYLVLLLFVI